MLQRTSITLFSLALLSASTGAQTLESELGWVNGRDGDRFGASAAISGNIAVFGATDDRAGGVRSGTAVVFERGAGGTWTQLQLLTPFDGRADDAFGTSVAIEGNTIIVGSPGHRTSSGGGGTGGGPGGTEEDQGAVYVFRNLGTGYTLEDKLIASDGKPFDTFGSSVAISGDHVLIGAPGVDGSVSNSGAAYVFKRSFLGFGEVARLTSSGQEAEQFGASVSIDGGRALVGAPRATNVSDNDGVGYVFEGSGASWTETARLGSDLGGMEGARLGLSVSLDGGRALLGAPSADRAGLDSGTALSFLLGGGGWALESELLPAGVGSQERFGTSVALSGDHAVVGALLGGELLAGAGSAYSFMSDGSGFDGGSLVPAPFLQAADGFGTAVAADGNLFLVGAPLGDGNEVNSGAGYAYLVDQGASIVAYCFCASAAPCGNVDASAGCATSVGSGALLSSAGSSSASADDLVLTVSGVPAGQFGILYMGGGQIVSPFGDGQRCVGAGSGAICRFPVQSTGSGSFSQGGLVAFSQSQPLSCRIDAGETWNFQGWFRDPAGPCGAGFNLSNAVSVTFQP